MLVKPHELVAAAFAGHYALGAFNTSNLEMTQAIVAGAAAVQAPVIVQTSEAALAYAGLPVLVALVSAIAADAAVPVCLHLDHGHDPELVRRCIDSGYRSVMIDASTQDLATNIATVREIVTYAHARGVWVEAELGAMLGAEGARDLGGEETPAETLTNPKDVVRFVEETGIDSLAVSVGTIHGAFTGQEYIRFELLEVIEAASPALPLVIHGASGIAADHLKAAAATNVCKINVDTEMRLAFEEAVKAYFSLPHDKSDPRDILAPAREAVQRVVEEKLRLFGCADRARV